MQHLLKPGRGRAIRVAPSTHTGKGRRVFAVGSINGRSSRPCCGGYETVKVRIGGELRTVHCTECNPQGVAL